MSVLMINAPAPARFMSNLLFRFSVYGNDNWGCRDFRNAALIAMREAPTSA